MMDLHLTSTTGGSSPHVYEDHGIGKAVILVPDQSMHGASWANQTEALLAAGYRVITYARRNAGESILQDIGTRAADLQVLIDILMLHDFALVGHSEGTGDIARYFARYGSLGVSKVALIASTLSSIPIIDSPTECSKEIDAIEVSTLIVHGDDDQISPVEQTAIPLAKRIRGSRLVIIEGGGHNIISTHAGRVNHELVAFLR
jgi:pimeloyl-ACP methyl ester carboxylesterase